MKAQDLNNYVKYVVCLRIWLIVSIGMSPVLGCNRSFSEIINGDCLFLVDKELLLIE